LLPVCPALFPLLNSKAPCSAGKLGDQLPPRDALGAPAFGPCCAWWAAETQRVAELPSIAASPEAAGQGCAPRAQRLLLSPRARRPQRVQPGGGSGTGATRLPAAAQLVLLLFKQRLLGKAPLLRTADAALLREDERQQA